MNIPDDFLIWGGWNSKIWKFFSPPLGLQSILRNDRRYPVDNYQKSEHSPIVAVAIPKYCFNLAKKFPTRCTQRYFSWSNSQGSFVWISVESRLPSGASPSDPAALLFSVGNVCHQGPRSDPKWFPATRLHPCRSWAWPGLTWKPVGLQRASQVAWILVVRSPREKPIHSWCNYFFCESTVLSNWHFKDLLPDATPINACDECESRESCQSVWADRSKECIPDNGRPLPRQRSNYPWYSRRRFPPCRGQLSDALPLIIT